MSTEERHSRVVMGALGKEHCTYIKENLLLNGLMHWSLSTKANLEQKLNFICVHIVSCCTY